ncbi:STAS domain-containing protein [soil metagenome]
MKYSMSEDGNIVVVKFEGKIMGAESAEFHKDIKDMIAKGKTNFIGDLSGVSFLNSTGLGMFIAALTSLRKADGDFKLCSAPSKIESLFRVSKLFTIFNYYKTLEQAKADFK